MSTPLVPCSSILVGARDFICATLPFSNYHSVPIPMLREGRLCAGVLIGRGEFTEPGSGYQIWHPHLLAIFNATDGSLEELRGIGGGREAEKALGPGISPIEKTEVEFAEALAKYQQTADAVLAAANESADYSEHQEALRAGFSRCTGEPLLLYFDELFMRDMGSVRAAAR